MIDYEFYPTPDPFTRYLFDRVRIEGRCAEAMCGDQSIVRTPPLRCPGEPPAERAWVTNDLDPRWPADFHLDATDDALYEAIGPVDWHVGNPAFTSALAAIQRQIAHARVGVAMHLRASIHEVLKTGERRTWMARFKPTGILWLPRFAYQRSKTTGLWTTDNVCACWVIWLKDPAAPQFIDYAPEWMLDELRQSTKSYRKTLDALNSVRASSSAVAV